MAGKPITTTEFIRRAHKRHGNKYDYSLTAYCTTRDKVIIICPVHGEFRQKAERHIEGYGCFACGVVIRAKKKTLTTNDFIRRAALIHAEKYDYSKSNYRHNQQKITIVCNLHGDFMQTPNNHLTKKHGCPVCANSNTSIMEKSWLDSLEIKTLQRRLTLNIAGRKYRPDGYDPVTNTVYEFWGDFWHGNPQKFNLIDINPKNKKTFGELYKETTDKIKMYEDSGYNLIYIWERNFVNT